MSEIVAAKIGTVITNNPRLIVAALELGQDMEFIDRRRMQFMAACDLGPHWGRLARAQTLFRLDDDGNPIVREAE